MMEDMLRDSQDFFKDSPNSIKTANPVEGAVCSVRQVWRISERCRAFPEGESPRVFVRLSSLGPSQQTATLCQPSVSSIDCTGIFRRQAIIESRERTISWKEERWQRT